MIKTVMSLSLPVKPSNIENKKMSKSKYDACATKFWRCRRTYFCCFLLLNIVLRIFLNWTRLELRVILRLTIWWRCCSYRYGRGLLLIFRHKLLILELFFLIFNKLSCLLLFCIIHSFSILLLINLLSLTLLRLQGFLFLNLLLLLLTFLFPLLILLLFHLNWFLIHFRRLNNFLFFLLFLSHFLINVDWRSNNWYYFLNL